MTSRAPEWRVAEGGFSESYRANGGDWRAAALKDLQAAGVVPVGRTTNHVSVFDLEPWIPGGGEVYICGIEVLDVDAPVAVRHVACKAIVSGAGGLSARADEWVSRARTLRSLGIETGTYGQCHAVVYQDWIANRLIDVLDLGKDILDLGKAARLAQMLQRLVIRLGMGGFRPTSILPDLRIEGDRIFLTDLGYDLGPAGTEGTTDRIGRLLIDECNRYVGDPRSRAAIVDAINGTIAVRRGRC